MNNKNKDEGEVRQLSIFLIKKEYKMLKDIIKESECCGPFKVKVPNCGKGALYIKKSMKDAPKWASFFESKNIIKRLGSTSNVSAVFILKVSDRYFALTFGQGGRFLLKNDVYEDRFGLCVALNSVERTSIRCIDKQSLNTIQSHTRVQSIKETTADQFGIDVEQDMLKAIVGTPKDPSIGSRMTGTDSLSVSVKMDLSDLKLLLLTYKDKFEAPLSSEYQWVNNISIVKNSSIINKLNDKLVNEFNKFDKKDDSSLCLAIPEIIQWDYVKGFIFEPGNENSCPDINLEEFLSTVEPKKVNLGILKNRRVYCVDEEDTKVFKSWPIYKCIYFETSDEDGNTHIFNDAKWFLVNNDFVNKTNEKFKDIIKFESQLDLPNYKGGGEEKYNSSVAKNSSGEYALLDRGTIHHGGGERTDRGL